MKKAGCFSCPKHPAEYVCYFVGGYPGLYSAVKFVVGFKPFGFSASLSGTEVDTFGFEDGRLA